MREIRIRWAPLDVSVTIKLDGSNPHLADLVWRALPYQSLQGHALVAGHHLYHLAPIHELLHTVPSERIDRRQAPDGTVFASTLQHLGIKYGPLTEPMPASPIGHVIPADLPTLSEVGKAVWDAKYWSKNPIIAEVTRVDHQPGNHLNRLVAVDPEIDRLIGDIYAATEKSWLAPPPALAEMHNGYIPSRAGSFDTVLPTLLFVNGETRPLGYATYGGLVRAASQTEIPVAQLQEMARILIAVPAEFLGYCGLDELWSFTERTLAVLDRANSRNDFLALMSHMALYVNCLGGWNLQLFPWHVGDHLRQEVR